MFSELEAAGERAGLLKDAPEAGSFIPLNDAEEQELRERMNTLVKDANVYLNSARQKQDARDAAQAQLLRATTKGVPGSWVPDTGYIDLDLDAAENAFTTAKESGVAQERLNEARVIIDEADAAQQARRQQARSA